MPKTTRYMAAQYIRELVLPTVLALVQPVNALSPLLQNRVIQEKTATINEFLVTRLPITPINVLFTPTLRHPKKQLHKQLKYLTLPDKR